MPQQFVKTPLGIYPRALPELIALIQDASIGRISRLGSVKSLNGRLCIAAHIEKRDAKIAMDSGKRAIQRCGALPEIDRLLISSAIVEQISEIVWRTRISWDCLHHSLQCQHLFQPMREAIVGWGGCGAPPGTIAFRRASN